MLAPPLPDKLGGHLALAGPELEEGVWKERRLTVRPGRSHGEEREARCRILLGGLCLAKGPSPAASQITKPVSGTGLNQPGERTPFCNPHKSAGCGSNEHSLLPGEGRIHETSGGVELRAIPTQTPSSTHNGESRSTRLTPTNPLAGRIMCSLSESQTLEPHGIHEPNQLPIWNVLVNAYPAICLGQSTSSMGPCLRSSDRTPWGEQDEDDTPSRTKGLPAKGGTEDATTDPQDRAENARC